MRNEKLHAVCREAHFQVKSVKNPRSQTTFGSSDVEKVRAVVARSTFVSKKLKTLHVRTTFQSSDVENVHIVVARSTFASQNVQSTPFPDHFWKLRCRKSARRCGAKHISKSKVYKTQGFRPLFDVQISKKCTPLWREAYFQVKNVKNRGYRTTF